MDILSALHEFCEAHNIKYSISYGSLLGAARHKGYIPWDDDIDIAILREDYEKLMALFPKTYKNKFCIASMSREKKWKMPFAKAYDNTTIFIEPGCSFPLGINIDIFPVDDIPDDDKKWQKNNKLRKQLFFIYNLKNTQFPSDRSIIKNIIIGITLAILSIFPKRSLSRWIEKFITRNNGKGYSRCTEACNGFVESKPYSKDLFKSIKLYSFEDRYFNGFEDYNTYLTANYGDWRKLPPMEKRKSHHINKSYWKD